MSRSYKKYPCWSDNKRGAKWAKRQASKRVRRSKGVFNGSSYKNLYCRWNIHDYKSVDYDFNRSHPYMAYAFERVKFLEKVNVYDPPISLWDFKTPRKVVGHRWVERFKYRPLPRREDKTVKWWRGYYK